MKTRVGKFEVIDCFAIRRRNEFYFIGNVSEGRVDEQFFVNVPLNKSLSVTARISSVEDVEFSGHQGGQCTLVIVKGDSELLDFLISLNIGSESLDITIDGEN